MNPDASTQRGRDDFPHLCRSYKNRFPFRLSVPSFVYPADYVTNALHLGPYVDEIELLLFESRDDSLPTDKELASLADLRTEIGISYNVHLPLDLDLGTRNEKAGDDAVAQLSRIVEKIKCLSATTHTLHLNCDLTANAGASQIRDWQERITKRLERLLSSVSLEARQISVETLGYPPQWFAPVVSRLALSVCIDIGHVVRYGFDLSDTLAQFADAVTILHLHGVDQGRDHTCLDRLDTRSQATVKSWISQFNGSVSLEIFSFKPLQRSLDYLTDVMLPMKPRQGSNLP